MQFALKGVALYCNAIEKNKKTPQVADKEAKRPIKGLWRLHLLWTGWPKFITIDSHQSSDIRGPICYALIQNPFNQLC
jgi:hypothetical protein